MLSSAKLARGGEQEMSSRWVADLFGPNAADGDLGEDVAKVMGKVASFYTAPVVKFLVRFLIHLVNLVLYTALINQFVTSGEIDERTSVCKTLYPYPEEGTSLGGQRWDCMMAHEKMTMAVEHGERSVSDLRVRPPRPPPNAVESLLSNGWTAARA